MDRTLTLFHAPNTRSTGTRMLLEELVDAVAVGATLEGGRDGASRVSSGGRCHLATAPLPGPIAQGQRTELLGGPLLKNVGNRRAGHGPTLLDLSDAQIRLTLR